MVYYSTRSDCDSHSSPAFYPVEYQRILGQGDFLEEAVEGGEVFGAEAGNGGFDALEGVALPVAGLGVELVGNADEALKARFGHVGRNADSCVALGHACGPFGRSLAAQKVGSERPVVDVGLGAVAVDGGRGGQENADVMEHRGGAHLLGVKLGSRLGAHLLGQVGDREGMAHINIPKGRYGIFSLTCWA